ncbi:hypothetical protein HOE425_333499 [Hoeflea sp. EC-HK425]|nr:hypothetical protein HOE425_333499 [Hoeflea sp. EC-HK425]
MRSPEAVREVRAYHEARPQDGSAADAGLTVERVAAAVMRPARNNPAARALRSVEVNLESLFVMPRVLDSQAGQKKITKFTYCCRLLQPAFAIPSRIRHDTGPRAR